MHNQTHDRVNTNRPLPELIEAYFDVAPRSESGPEHVKVPFTFEMPPATGEIPGA